jgi:tetratricopeptide (TPR) repeat protein
MGNSASLAPAGNEAEGSAQVTPEVWQRVKEVLAGALEREPRERPAYLDHACVELSLRKEVESLIFAHEQTDSIFLEHPAPEGTTLKSGTMLGSYEIVEILGAGGMGEVYKAHDTKLKRDVAIKVLPAAFVNDPDRLSRFQREARMLASLNHPNIATIHGFEVPEQSGGTHYLVMELVPGQTLAERLSAGGLGIEQALEVAGQIAGALDAAHEKGVIHRDLKPANVKVTPEGRVKVLDFGLAKAFAKDGGQDFSKVPTLSSMDSEEGKIVGTPSYMSPEQAQGKPVDKRTDIWSFGCLLYELLTGQRAFRGENATETLAKILEREPDWQALPPATPAKIRELLLLCLQKDPQRRLHDIREAKIEIAGAQRGGSAPGVAGHRVRILATTLLAVVVLGTGVAAIPSIRARIHTWLGEGAIPQEKQLAVLPFQVVGGDASAKAFSDGLTETLTTKLTQLTVEPTLQVIPAPEIRARGTSTIDDARKEFGATLVMEGNLQRSGDRVRINIAMVDARTHRQVRAESLTIAASDPFAVQDQVVNAAIEMLALEVQPGEREALQTHGTEVASAYDFYLQGLGYLQNYDKMENIESAVKVFDTALQLDPQYALAYAGRGEAYWKMYESSKDANWIESSRRDCGGAIKLDRSLLAGHVCLGRLYKGTGRYQDAVAEFERAIETEPTDDDAYRELAEAYQQLGKSDQAEATYRRAIELRPHYWAGYNWLGVFYYHRARYADAAEMFEKASALAPDNARALYNLGASYVGEGRYADAIAVLKRSITIRPSGTGFTDLGNAYFYLRRYDEATRAYEQAVNLDQANVLLWWNLGDGYYWTPGKHAQAVEAYQRAISLARGNLRVNPKDSYALGIMAICDAMLGEKRSALESLRKGLDLTPADPEMLFKAALLYNHFGDAPQALIWLGKALAKGFSPTTVRDTPDFDQLHADPQFQELLRPK